MGTEEHGLRQICHAGSVIGPPLDPSRAKEFFLPLNQNCFGVHRLAGKYGELPDSKSSERFKDFLSFSVNRNLAMLNKTTFMLDGFSCLSFISPDTLDMSGMCFFERLFCGSIKVNEPDFGKRFQGLRMLDNAICG